MKIRCPKCKYVIKLGITKLPATGIEIQCPDCEARFRLRSKEGNSPPANEASEAAPSSSPLDSSPPPAGINEPAPPAPQQAPPAPGGGGPDLGGLADLLQELDDMPVAEDTSAGVMYQVRGQRGNVFGPFDAPTILGMLDNGQLTGSESLSPDGQSWHPMGDWSDFQDKVATLQPLPQDDNISWENSSPPMEHDDPAEAMDSSFEPPNIIREDEEQEEEQEIRRIERKAPQRIRTALREDVIEAESNRVSLSDLNSIKESLKAVDKKWFIIAAVGLILIVSLTYAGLAFLQKPKVIVYKNINIPLAGVFAQDDDRIYKGKVIPRITRMHRRNKKHPQLIAYKAIALAMYLEHYGPNPNMSRQLQHLIRTLPRPAKKKKKGANTYKPKAVEYWARAMQAMVQRKANLTSRNIRQMRKLASSHFAIPYMQAKVQVLRRRYKQAEKLFQKAEAKQSTPVRINFSRGEMYLRWKKWDKAFNSFYKVILINKKHFPSYLKLLEIESKLPSQKTRYKDIWKNANKVFAKVRNKNIKARFLYKQAMREAAQGKPNKALGYLLGAIRIQPRNIQFQRKLPDLYLSTYDYSKTIFFLKKMMSRPGKLKPSVVSTFLQVLFRINKAKEARTRVADLLKRCPRCKKDHDFWVWRARVEEASQLQAIAVQSLNQALHIRKNKSVAALAAKARNAWKANHPKLTRKILILLDSLKPQSTLDRLSLTELFILLKRKDDAYTIIKPLIQSLPRDEYVNRLGGQLLLQKNKFVEAEKLFKRSIKTWKNCNTCIVGLARALDEQNKYKQAIPYLIKTIELYPAKASNYFRLGRLFYLIKKYKEASTYLRKGLEIRENNHEAHYFLGLAKEALGEKDMNVLIEHFERALSIAPTNLKYLLKLAGIQMKVNRTKEALQLFSRLLASKKLPKKTRAKVLMSRGKLLYDRKLWSYALKDFRGVTRLSPKNNNVIRWIAKIYRQMNRKRLAVRWYKKALRRYKKSKPKMPVSGIPSPELASWKVTMADLNARLGDLYQSQGRRQYRRAIRYFRTALKLHPKLGYYRQLGYLYKDLRRWGTCVRYFKVFLKKAPKNNVDRDEIINDLRACRNNGRRY